MRSSSVDRAKTISVKTRIFRIINILLSAQNELYHIFVTESQSKKGPLLKYKYFSSEKTIPESLLIVKEPTQHSSKRFDRL